MKRLLIPIVILATCILIMTGCGNSNSVESTSKEEVETALDNTENTDTVEKIIPTEFNHATNQIVVFGEYQFEIPHDWIYEIVEADKSVYFHAEHSDTLLFSFSDMGISNVLDLSKDDEAAEVTAALIKAFQDIIGNCEFVACNVPKSYIELGGKKVDTTGGYELHIECKGTYQDLPYVGKIIAFYMGDTLYAFNLFQLADSPYDYYEEMCSVQDTIKLAETENDIEISTPTDENESTDNVEINAEPEELSEIEVTFTKDYTDGDRLHLKVYVNNNSDKTFTGDVHVFFYSRDGKDRLGSDMIIVEDLEPGRQNWANVTIDKYDGTPQLELEFTDPLFSEVEEITTEIDTDATEKTKNSYKLNFEGVSWYEDVTDIVVYADGNCVVTIKNNSKEKGQFYASTIWSCGNDHGVEAVQVIDADGNIKSVYP